MLELCRQRYRGYENHELIASTVRLMKTQRALLVLKVLAKLRGMGSRHQAAATVTQGVLGVVSWQVYRWDRHEERERPEMRILIQIDTSHIDLPEEISNLMHHLLEVNHDDGARQTSSGVGVRRKARQ